MKPSEQYSEVSKLNQNLIWVYIFALIISYNFFLKKWFKMPSLLHFAIYLQRYENSQIKVPINYVKCSS